MRVFQTLSTKLLLLLLGVMAVVFVLNTYINVTVQSSHLMETVLQSANRTSDLIKRSTHYSMMLNRKEDLYQIIKTIAAEPGFDGVRIYNKRGEIMFSGQSSEIGTSVDMKAEACYACHSQEKPIESLAYENRTRIFTSAAGYRVLGLINPIKNEPDCYTASCHAHPESKTVLGVLDVRMSLKQVDEHLAESKKQMILSAFATVAIIGLVSAGFLVKVVRQPVRRLIEGTKEISGGNLDFRIPSDSKDELGELGSSFNRMATELKRAYDEITRWSATLEEKVKQKSDELQKVQDHIVLIEKMASLGQLSATVAHELNNPLEGVLTYTKLLRKKLENRHLSDNEIAEMINQLTFIADETVRCGNIVKNLLLFSKAESAGFKSESLNNILEKCVRLIGHHLEIHSITLKRELDPNLPPVECDANQLQQAFLAMTMNAVEAMPEGGILTLRTTPRPEQGVVEVAIEDTGIGIPPEILPKIFEPFFTTKSAGKGVGLGLSVAYGIVEHHGGRIEVDSQVNRGTTFTVVLPLRARGGRGKEEQGVRTVRISQEVGSHEQA
jgi:two-component system NtrC family sensor kinase